MCASIVNKLTYIFAIRIEKNWRSGRICLYTSPSSTDLQFWSPSPMMFPAEPVGLSLVYLPCTCVGKCIILVCRNTRPISHPSLITSEPLHKHIHMEIHLIIRNLKCLFGLFTEHIFMWILCLKLYYEHPHRNEILQISLHSVCSMLIMHFTRTK